MLTGGIPLAQILDLVRTISRHAIIEHIAPEDQSVRTMTAGRRWASVPDVDEFRGARGSTADYGEHTDEILAELGYDDEQVLNLKAASAVW